MIYDVVIVGGGPAGLAAALTLGIARKRVLLCDSGPRRNAAANHMHNFVTRDGASPAEFRAAARDQLRAYPNVEATDAAVVAITGARGAFGVQLADREVQARRILLATGMIDEALPVEGFSELWGRSIFQCPYCHGWDVQDRPWGYLAGAVEAPMITLFALQARAWTRELTVFTNGRVEVPEADQNRLIAAGIRVETGEVARLVSSDGALEGVELASGEIVPCVALFAHPPQRQVPLVRALGLDLDEFGYVRSDAGRKETSIPGIHAAGDLANRQQAAIFAAAAGTHAGVVLNLELTVERVSAAA